MGEGVLTDAINAIVVSPLFPSRPHVLALQAQRLMISRDGGRSWSPWKDGLHFDEGLTCVAAPCGLDAGALLLVGLGNGGVRRVSSAWL